jgi:hypothetical protein
MLGPHDGARAFARRGRPHAVSGALGALAVLAPLALSAASAAAATAPAAATAAAAPARAAARRDRAALTTTSVRLGTKTAPVLVAIRVRPTAEVEVRVNGRRPDAPLQDAGGNRRVLTLTASDGLRQGVNRLRIRATLPDGRYDVERRSFRIDRAHPIADAGDDHAHTIGSPLRLGVRRAGLMAAPSDGRTTRSWRIVRQPRGARATLRGARSARPTLHAPRTGTYVLRLTTRGTEAGAVSHDMVTATVRPDDPPIGVTIRTLAPDSGDTRQAAVWIDGKPAPDTYDRNGIFVVVLERATRKIVQSGTTPRHGGGIEQLSGIAKNWDLDKRYVMILGAPKGVLKGDDSNRMIAMLRQIGVGLSDPDRRSLEANGPFSVIGVPGASEGTATTLFDRPHTTSSDAPNAGELTGLLQLNRLTATYDFVDPIRPTYDTSVGTDAQTNVIRFDGRTYSASLGAGVSGFHVVTIIPSGNGFTVADQGAYPTTTADDQKRFAAALKTIADHGAQPITIVQSIGTPKGQSNSWNAVTDQLERLGGNRLVVNALDGRANSTYALVGRVAMQSIMPESSGKSGGNGELAGGLARTRAWRWEPAVADETGTLDTSLIELAFQRATPFPALDSDGERAAMKWIVQQLRFCPASDRACDRQPATLRYYYWDGWSANWNTKLTLLTQMTRAPEGAGFSDADLRSVREHLVTEVAAVSDVKEYIEKLQKPISRSETGSLKELEDSTRNLLSDLDPPQGSSTLTNLFGLLDTIATSAGEKADRAGAGSASTVLGGLSGVMSLISFMSRPGDPYELGGEVRTRADKLASELIDRLEYSESAITGVGLLLVSDYGKLMAADAKVDNEWRIPADTTPAVRALKRATRGWVMSALVPVAYPYLVRATPPGRGGGVTDARHLQCKERQADRTTELWQGWPGQSVESQQRGIEAFETDGVAIEPVYFFTRGYLDTSPWHYRPFPAPTARLANELFNSPTATSDPGLGIDKLSFFDPRRFGGRLHRANHMAYSCDVRYMR